MVAEGLQISDITLAIVLIEKLPPWKEFRGQLMHKKDLPLEELIGHLKIEEENHIKDKGQQHSSFPSAKANLVEPKTTGPKPKIVILSLRGRLRSTSLRVPVLSVG